MSGWLPAVAIVAPLLGATATMALAPFGGWRLRDAAGIAFAGATAVLTGTLVLHDDLLVSWIGGWEPVGGRAIGIALTVDPVGAGTAALAALLTTAALLYSWRYFESVGPLYHTLMLLFLGGMVGFTLTGDLFNLFVFFELLTTAAYALTAYDVERQGPLHGALNFAITNTIGGFLLLHGIGLLYARTGTLAFADIGRSLEGATPDLLLVTSFAMLSAGLFTKAAIVPFHLWLPDAHAVAPSPVSVLLSGVMIELGLYGWARSYWTMFADVFADHVEALRLVVVGLGITTAVVAALFALVQHHLKRLLAYSSVSHSGLILIGLGLFDASGVTGAAIYTFAHGGIKGALFLLAGIVLHHHGTVDEIELHGRGRDHRWTAAVTVLAALALAGLPPFGTALGKQLVEEAAVHHGLGAFVTAAFTISGALTAAAVLRAAGRIFRGWGSHETLPGAGVEEDEHEETNEPTRRTPAVMMGAVLLLLVSAIAVGVVPAVARTADAAAQLFVATRAYAAAVLDGTTATLPPVEHGPTLTAHGTVVGGLVTLLAVVVAGGALSRTSLTRAARRASRRFMPAVEAVRSVQSGHVGDYVAWMTLGLAALTGAYVAALL